MDGPWCTITFFYDNKFRSDGLALAPLGGRFSGNLGGIELAGGRTSRGGGSPFLDIGGLPWWWPPET